jgi:hypothetical protein
MFQRSQLLSSSDLKTEAAGLSETLISTKLHGVTPKKTVILMHRCSECSPQFHSSEDTVLPTCFITGS